jgi:hypothetical protein
MNLISEVENRTPRPLPGRGLIFNAKVETDRANERGQLSEACACEEEKVANLGESFSLDYRWNYWVLCLARGAVSAEQGRDLACNVAG